MGARFIEDPNIGRSLGPGWRATKFLGRGSFGIVSLWEYTGRRENAPRTTQIAVKHTSGWNLSDLLYESKILDDLNRAKSRHIVKQLRPPYEPRQHDGSIQLGMFLEYCPNGVLDDLMDPQGRYPLIVEKDLWDLFYCLSLAVSAMARGTESLSSRPVSDGRCPACSTFQLQTPLSKFYHVQRFQRRS